jgi:RNA polymerase subunit RPABC4/transcription elongation factor Spt4
MEENLNFNDIRVCPKCNRHYPADVRFCNADGTELVSPDKMIPKCVKCGTVYQDGTKFCPIDGGQIIPEALRTNLINDLKDFNLNNLKDFKVNEHNKPDILKLSAFAMASIAGLIDFFIVIGSMFSDKMRMGLYFGKWLFGAYLNSVIGWIVFALILAGGALYINAALLKDENKDMISKIANIIIYCAGGLALLYLLIGLSSSPVRGF